MCQFHGRLPHLALTPCGCFHMAQAQCWLPPLPPAAACAPSPPPQSWCSSPRRPALRRPAPPAALRPSSPPPLPPSSLPPVLVRGHACRRAVQRARLPHHLPTRIACLVVAVVSTCAALQACHLQRCCCVPSPPLHIPCNLPGYLPEALSVMLSAHDLPHHASDLLLKLKNAI